MATGDAKIRIEAEDKFSRQFQSLRSQLSSTTAFASGEAKKISSAFDAVGLSIGTLAGGLTFGAIVASVRSLVSSLDDLEEAAQSVGISAVALSELRTSARLSGVESDQLGQALTKLNVKIADAAAGSKEAQAVFKAMGISFKDANGNARGTEEVLRDVASKFATYGDGAERAALAVDLFGRGGAKLIPYLRQGADGLRTFSGLTDETVIAAQKLQGEFDRLSVSAEKFKNAIASKVVPAINDAIDILPRIDFGAVFKEFVFNPIPGAALVEYKNQILSARKELDDFNDAQAESKRLANSPLANASLVKAPVVKAEKGAAKEEITEAQQALAQFNSELQRRIDKTEELTNVERALNLLKENPSIDTPQVRELALMQAKIADDAEREAEAKKEIDRLIKSQVDESNRLYQSVLDLAGVAEENRKRALTEQLEIMIKQGLLTSEQSERAVLAIAGIKNEAEKAGDAAGQFALTIASSLGRFLENPREGNFFKALLEDMTKLTTQLLIIEPLTKSLRQVFGGGSSSSGGGSGFDLAGFVKGLFAGGFASGGVIPAGRWGIVGENGPEPAFGGATGLTVVPSSSGGSRPINMSVVVNVPANVSRDTASQVAVRTGREVALKMRKYG